MNKILSIVAFSMLCWCSGGISSQYIGGEAPIPHPGCPLTDVAKLLPYPNSCTKYYSCHHGLAYALNCPDNLKWDSRTERCDYEINVNCFEDNVTVPPPIPSTTSSDAIYYKPHPTDCSSFYQCLPMRCPANYYWNNLAGRCYIGNNFNCVQSTTGYPSTIPVSTLGPPTIIIPTAATPPPLPLTTYQPPIANITYAPHDDPNLNALCSASTKKYIPYPGDCHKFIQCEVIAYVIQCPPYLYWNSALNVCDNHCV